jgi:hypothetical protein
MTGTNCDLFTHKSSRSYLNHLVLLQLSWCFFIYIYLTSRYSNESVEWTRTQIVAKAGWYGTAGVDRILWNCERPWPPINITVLTKYSNSTHFLVLTAFWPDVGQRKLIFFCQKLPTEHLVAPNAFIATCTIHRPLFTVAQLFLWSIKTYGMWLRVAS